AMVALVVVAMSQALTRAVPTFELREGRSADVEGPSRWWMTAAVVVVALLSIATIQRNAEYRSGLTLWQTVLDRWPTHARAHRNLAAELQLANRRAEEIQHLTPGASDL